MCYVTEIEIINKGCHRYAEIKSLTFSETKKILTLLKVIFITFCKFSLISSFLAQKSRSTTIKLYLKCLKLCFCELHYKVFDI